MSVKGVRMGATDKVAVSGGRVTKSMLPIFAPAKFTTKLKFSTYYETKYLHIFPEVSHISNKPITLQNIISINLPV